MKRLRWFLLVAACMPLLNIHGFAAADKEGRDYFRSQKAAPSRSERSRSAPDVEQGRDETTGSDAGSSWDRSIYLWENGNGHTYSIEFGNERDHWGRIVTTMVERIDNNVTRTETRIYDDSEVARQWEFVHNYGDYRKAVAFQTLRQLASSNQGSRGARDRSERGAGKDSKGPRELTFDGDSYGTGRVGDARMK